MERKVYFHLKRSKSSKILIISIADKKDGPFYVFKRIDRNPKRHQFLSSMFEAISTKDTIAKFKNVSVVLKSSTLKQYYDIENKRYQFRGCYLGSVFELEETYSGKIILFLIFVFVLILNLFLFKFRCRL